MRLLISLLVLFAQRAPGRAVQTGTIAGQVFSMDGAAAANIRVTALVAPDSAADVPAEMARIVQTDSSGRYRLDDVPPGRYFVTAGRVEFPTYYPGVTKQAEAKAVIVSAGAVVDPIDFRLARPDAVAVRGRVVRESNQPPPVNQRIVLAGDSPPSQNIIIPPDGRFEFPKVASGNYTIFMSPPNGAQPQQIVVDDKDVQVELIAPLTVTVTGTVVIDQDGPRPQFGLTFLEAGGYRAAAGMSTNGTFTVALPPGEYRLTPAVAPAGFTYKSVLLGSTDVLRTPMKISAEDKPELIVNIGVSSPPPWVKVSGRVIGAGNSPVPLRVNITGAATSGSSRIPIDPLEAAVGPDGTFEFPKVLPGVYSARPSVTKVYVRTNITVGNDDVSDIQIVVPPSREFLVRMTVEGDAPAPNLLSFGITDSSGAGQQTPLSSIPNRRDGTFTLTIPEGEHRIVATPPTGYTLKSMSVGNTDLMSSPLKVSAADPAEIRVTLAPVHPFVKLTGRLVGFEDIVLSGPPGFPRPMSSPIRDDGSFEFSKLPPGRYTLQATASGLSITRTLDVSDKDITGLEIRAPSRISVKGQISVEDDGPSNPGFDLNLTGSIDARVYVAANTGGAFTVQLPSGEHRVSVARLPNGLTVKSFTFGDVDLLRNPLQLSDSNAQELRLTLKSTGPFVRVCGKVILPPGKEIGDLLRRPVMSLMQPLREVPIAPDGSFEIPKAIPGDYNWCCDGPGFTHFTVPAHDLDGLALHAIPGRITFESGRPGARIYVNANDGGMTSAGSLQADGSFTLILAEGVYTLSLSLQDLQDGTSVISDLPSGTIIKSMSYGATELVSSRLNVVPDKLAEELRIVVGAR